VEGGGAAVDLTDWRTHLKNKKKKKMKKEKTTMGNKRKNADLTDSASPPSVFREIQNMLA